MTSTRLAPVGGTDDDECTGDMARPILRVWGRQPQSGRPDRGRSFDPARSQDLVASAVDMNLPPGKRRKRRLVRPDAPRVFNACPGAELARALPGGGLTHHLAGLHVQGRVQGRGPVALVVMGPTLDLSRPKGQQGGRTITSSICSSEI
jgi:hypothetical protein